MVGGGGGAVYKGVNGGGIRNRVLNWEKISDKDEVQFVSLVPGKNEDNDVPKCESWFQVFVKIDLFIGKR